MRRLRIPALIALGVVAYLAFLAAGIPASFVAEKVRSAGMLELDDVSGTIWNGTARASVRLPTGMLTLDSVQWRLLPSRLIAGRLAYGVKAGAKGFDATMNVERALSVIEVRDLDARADAQAIAAFAPLLAGARPEGRVTIVAPMLAWDWKELRGEASAEWRAAATALSEIRPLGSYRAEVHATGGPAKIVVTTLEGPLRVSGQGVLTPPSRFTFSGEARADGPSAAALEPLLNLMGPRRADGARALEWR
jgi:general secretion pathway protein N